MKIFFVTSKLKNPNTAAGSVIELDYMMKELMRLGNEVTAVTVFSKTNDLTEPPPYKLIEENINSVKLFPLHGRFLRFCGNMKKIATFFILTGSIFMAEGFINFSEAKNLSLPILYGSRQFSANTHPFFLIIVLGGKNIRLNLFGSFLKEK